MMSISATSKTITRKSALVEVSTNNYQTIPLKNNTSKKKRGKKRGKKKEREQKDFLFSLYHVRELILDAT